MNTSLDLNCLRLCSFCSGLDRFAKSILYLVVENEGRASLFSNPEDFKRTLGPLVATVEELMLEYVLGTYELINFPPKRVGAEFCVETRTLRDACPLIIWEFSDLTLTICGPLGCTLTICGFWGPVESLTFVVCEFGSKVLSFWDV